MSLHTQAFRHVSGALLACLLTLLAACSSVDPYAVNRKVLDTSYGALEQGQYQVAARESESLFAGRAAQANEFRLQRYYAAFLCARAHVEAALHQPFLQEPAPATSGLGIATVSGPRGDGMVASPTAHWVAAAYYAGFARDAFAAAARDASADKDGKLLPPELAKWQIELAEANLDLTRLAVLRRLGFDAECSAILEASPDMLDVARCQQILEQAQLPKNLRPLIFYAGFAHMRLRASPTDSRSQANTNQLGATARVLADEASGSLPQECINNVIAWVDSNPNFEFQCKCNKKFQSSALRCQVCGSSIVQFTVREKSRNGQ